VIERNARGRNRLWVVAYEGTPALKRKHQWTTDEDDALRQLTAGSRTLDVIARRLRRPEGGVRRRAIQLGLPVFRKPRHRFSITAFARELADRM
jgi:hypothetical protein